MRFALLAMALSVISLPAAALDWHVGVGVGTKLDGRTGDIPGADKHSDTPKLLLGGVTFKNDFGVEASWVDLGDISTTGLADVGYDVGGDLWTLAATWSPDTGALRPFAKLGWFNRNEDGTSLTVGSPMPASYHDSGVTAELGGRWFINDTFALRGGYAWYDFDHHSDGNVQAALELRF